MRTETIGNITLVYPDPTCWLGDNVFIELIGGNVQVGAQIQITELASGKYRKLKHISEIEKLVFPLNDTLKSLYHGAISFNCVVNLYENKQLTGSFGFDFDCLNGKSIPMRAHGSTRTIYAYSQEDLRKVQMLFPASGSLSVNNHSIPILTGGMLGIDLRGWITDNGTYPMCFVAGAKGGGESTESGISIVNAYADTPFSGIVQLSFADTSGEIPAGETDKGDVWADSKFNSERYCVDLVYEEECPDFNFFEVMYYDTDGCIRFLGGKILEQTTNATAKNYYRLDTSTVYRDISRRYLEESNGTVKVGYDNLRRDSYWGDILLSDEVWFKNYNGDWINCSIVDKKVTVKSDDTQDVELTFELFAN